MRSVSEKIDERILRLLGLEDVFDIDYDTYLTLLKEAIVTGSKKLPQEELALLANERKRIRGKKGRFSPKKDKITADKVATIKFLKPSKKTLALAPPTTSPEEGGGFVGIKKTLDSILKTLGSKFKFDQKQADEDRKEKETEKRGKRESTLEGFKKGVAGIVATTQKMLSPFQAIIDRIWRFVFFTLLGRAFTKFMEWMSDKKNQDKFNAFIEFLSDHWPALAGLYILFGTSFGKLVRGLLKGATRMIIALAMNIGKIKRFIGKHKRLAFLGVALAPLATRELGNLLGENKETPESGLIPRDGADLGDAKKSVDQAANTQVPKLNLGGMVPSFKMGGMSPFGGMGGMDFYGGVPISGAGQDDTLIAAKTGEAILTERDQQDIGQRYVDRTTGQPLNIPQYLAGRKPGSVNMGNLSFPGFGGGFFGGGMISKFKDGGMVVSNKSGQVGGQTNLLKPQAKTIFDKLVKGGLTPNAAAGVVANIGVETGYTYDPNTYQRGGGPGRGLVQWEKGGRFDTDRINLMSFAKSRGTPWNNLNTQTDFILHELNTHPEYQRVKSKINTAKDVPTATNIFLREYEKAGTPHTQDRMKVAQQIVNAGYLKPKEKSEEKLNKKPPTFIDRLGQIANTVGSGFSGMFRPSPATAKPQKTPAKSQRWATDPRGLFGMQGGGPIKENTGMNIRGATADRQMIAAQPGEFVIPVDTVNRLGTSFFEKLVAMTDSNSNAYLGRGTTRRPQITPYSSSGSGSGGTITLPPITQSAGGSRARSAGLGGGSEVPEFSATAPNNERAMNASIYGLVG
jgi:hypothetical protein